MDQVDTHLTGPIALELVGPPENHVAEILDRLQLLDALPDPPCTHIPVRAPERGLAVAELGELLGLERDLHRQPIITTLVKEQYGTVLEPPPTRRIFPRTGRNCREASSAGQEALASR